jgi:hypothetical protein
MKRTLLLAATAAVSTSATPVLAVDHYMHCYGGGRAGLYYSDIFPVPEGTKSKDKALAFNAFVQRKYGTTVHTECHSDGSPALAASAKKITEDSDQKSKFPSKLIETGWKGN